MEAGQFPILGISKELEIIGIFDKIWYFWRFFAIFAILGIFQPFLSTFGRGYQTIVQFYLFVVDVAHVRWKQVSFPSSAQVKC